MKEIIFLILIIIFLIIIVKGINDYRDIFTKRLRIKIGLGGVEIDIEAKEKSKLPKKAHSKSKH